MNFPEPSLFEEDKYSQLLVRAVGSKFVDIVRSTLDEEGITYTLHARRRDDVEFWVHPSDIKRSRKSVMEASE